MSRWNSQSGVFFSMIQCVGGVFLLVYRLVESIYLLCLAVSRLKGV